MNNFTNQVLSRFNCVYNAQSTREYYIDDKGKKQSYMKANAVVENKN